MKNKKYSIIVQGRKSHSPRGLLIYSSPFKADQKSNQCDEEEAAVAKVGQDVPGYVQLTVSGRYFTLPI